MSWRVETTTYGHVVFRNARKVATIRQRPDGRYVAMYRGARVEGDTAAEVFARITGGAA